MPAAMSHRDAQQADVAEVAAVFGGVAVWPLAACVS
jgi:hypothetical protein